METLLKRRKAVLIGAGHVGSHAGYALAAQGLVEEIIYIDIDEKKALAQALDIFDATVYLPHRVEVKAGTYKDIDDADIMVVCAGPLPNMNQTRMDTLGATIEVMKDITIKIKNTKFSGIIINISNPADVITHYIQNKLNYDPKRIISTSTTLDSARLRRAISEAINVDQKSIHAYALGEHGESQMVPWSAVTIAGKPLFELMKEKEKYSKLDLKELANKGRRGGWDVLEGKGSTEFGIGTALAEVVRAVLCDEHRVLPVSVYLNGEYGQNDVYASVPAVLGRNGVEEIIEIKMNDDEKKLFDESCSVMKKNYELSLNM
ncbi:L-lactate dehydrogenase [Brachyspira hyodysenteriae]|uniref:L-lactate dehydrogenase n=1 Tax=Brachyspira hyodysenteriae (strain ATCC 49526 / WA1) TaxID=565034 RepID=A0A3B6V9Q7_BRAHW|nr:L-lactate dehydrogenase [Brachyspira hyodysenteriae]ACN84215.1 L-lactate dehydrogenase [Brachyspira hyodysenteriae WA1]KLI13194.1 lactate dehydrogenase [Brachyspira hyodysenteriae]KLI45734.1 lactate dehydrogenase [Brachyspira hyodysenteriae]KLI49001.1 lactate dehydrogenase [Brachyspira hyodysenteriae]KLI58446.1 lactate dehydrogenase [Brachyspira hyodysenteriae]